MPICYILLSPTLGMHQYTADLANRAAAGAFTGGEACETHLVTTATLIRDRYGPMVSIHTPVSTHGTGFAPDGLRLHGFRRALDAVVETGCHVAHITGVHAWNVPLARALRRRGMRLIHTLHDLDPHHGVRFHHLIRLWNWLIIALVDHILVHGECYRQRLLARGLPANRVTCVPLLHLFLSYEGERSLVAEGVQADALDAPLVLFFGRVEPYKGVDVLLAAWPRVLAMHSHARLVIAGPLAADVSLPDLPPNTELRDRWIGDAEAVALLRSASLLVLPYRDATQSALIAAAYYFGVPVIVTRTGALPEYIVEGETGWIVPPGDSQTLGDVLAKALSDPARLKRIGQQGRIWYQTQHRMEEATLAAMYRQIAAL